VENHTEVMIKVENHLVEEMVNLEETEEAIEVVNRSEVIEVNLLEVTEVNLLVVIEMVEVVIEVNRLVVVIEVVNPLVVVIEVANLLVVVIEAESHSEVIEVVNHLEVIEVANPLEETEVANPLEETEVANLLEVIEVESPSVEKAVDLLSEEVNLLENSANPLEVLVGNHLVEAKVESLSVEAREVNLLEEAKEANLLEEAKEASLPVEKEEEDEIIKDVFVFLNLLFTSCLLVHTQQIVCNFIILTFSKKREKSFVSEIQSFYQQKAID